MLMMIFPPAPPRWSEPWRVTTSPRQTGQARADPPPQYATDLLPGSEHELPVRAAPVPFTWPDERMSALNNDVAVLASAALLREREVLRSCKILAFVFGHCRFCYFTQALPAYRWKKGILLFVLL